MSVIKLILVLTLMVLAAVLTGFNLSNTCTIWFFHKFENIPVLAALMGTFLLGVFITLPFVFFKKKPRKNKKTSEAVIPTPAEPAPETPVDEK